MTNGGSRPLLAQERLRTPVSETLEKNLGGLRCRTSAGSRIHRGRPGRASPHVQAHGDRRGGACQPLHLGTPPTFSRRSHAGAATVCQFSGWTCLRVRHVFERDGCRARPATQASCMCNAGQAWATTSSSPTPPPMARWSRNCPKPWRRASSSSGRTRASSFPATRWSRKSRKPSRRLGIFSLCLGPRRRTPAGSARRSNTRLKSRNARAKITGSSRYCCPGSSRRRWVWGSATNRSR
jgi:hypothetical protein